MRKCIIWCMLGFVMCSCVSKPKYTEEELVEMPLAQRDGLPAPSGGFVLSVNGETITCDDVISPVMERLRPAAKENGFERFEELAQPGIEQIVVGRISNILLGQQAKKHLGSVDEGVLEKAVDEEVGRFVLRFGGDYAKAEQSLKQDGMDWQSYRKYQRKLILSQFYIQSKLPKQKPITHSELLDCYNRIKEEDYSTAERLQFRLIDIEVAKLEVTDPNKSRVELGKELALELVGRIGAGEDFGELAKKYSHGHRQVYGGLWRPVQPDSLAKPYDVLVAEAEKLQVGETAGPIEAEGHVFIIKLEDKQQANVEPFEKVQKQIEDMIIRERQKQAIDELSAELVKQAAIGEKDEFIGYCLRKIYATCNQ